MSQLHEAVIAAYGRSAVCKAGKGSLALTHPVDYAADVLNGVLAKVPQLNAADIDDIIVGCALPFGVQGHNIARLIATRAGLPFTITAQTVNRFCSSGLQSIAAAANAIRCGEEEVIIAGGVESMSMVPMHITNEADLNQWLVTNEPSAYMPMGLTAENVADQYGVNRLEMEEMAVESHRKAAWATEQGLYKKQIIPVRACDADGNSFLTDQDELIRRDTTLETLAKLKTPFKEAGKVTAGTSSPTSDGAAFVVLMSKEKALQLGIQPIARFVAFSTGGVPADVMGLGPIAAVPKVLGKTGLGIDDMDIIELNEAFAAQAIACIRELKPDPARLNPWGGALALGHPLGATGAILTGKVLSYLSHTNGRYGLVTMCIGGGMGAAGIFERIQDVASL